MHVPAHPSEREISDSEVEIQKRKHSIYTHFPKDRNCDMCLITKNTRVLCKRRNEGSIPRAEKFGDLIKADHKVLNEGSESRNNHRHAVVVQDLATQWIQSYPCQTKNSQATEKSLRKFLEPSQKPKVIYTANSLEFGKSCEDLSWNHRTSTPGRSETHGIAERATRRVKEGTSAVLLQSGLDEKWWSDSVECCCYLRNVQNLLAFGKTPYVRSYSTWCTGGISPKLRQKQSENSSNRKEIITGNLFTTCFDRGDIEELENLDASDIHPRRLTAKEVLITKKKRICISCGRWFSKIIRDRLRIPRIHSETGIHRKQRESQ